MKTREPVTKGVAKNVPVVMQMEALECGAASLAMILAYYGTWIPLEQLREDCGVSRDGSKAGNIARAAMTHGLTAKGNRLSLESIREKATFPCIIHWNFNHFVVLKGFKGDKVYINDPARGDIVISFKEFDNSYTGICLTFAPSEIYQPVGKKKSMAEFVKRRLQGTGNSLAFVAMTTAIASLCAMISTAFSRFFMDALLPGGNPDLEIPFLVFLSVLTAIWLGSLWLSAVFSYKFSGKFAATDNAKYFWHVMKLPMKFFSQRSASDIDQRRAASANIANMLINTLAPLAINTVMLVFYLVIMLRYSVFLTLIGVGSVAVNVAVTYWAGIKRTNLMRVLLRDQGKLISQTFTGVKSIETIKASGAENGFFHKWAGYQASALSAKEKFAKIDAYLGRLPLVITAFVNDVILVLGVWLVMKGRFSEGMVLAFAGLLTQFFQPAQMLVNAGRQIQEMRSQMERIEDVMSYHEDVVFDEHETEKPVGEEKPAKVQKKLSGQLTMKGVSFGYSRLSPPLIKDFNLELPQGKSVAFVGGSGCGKSTLSKLISGLYQPWEGEILFDGKSIGDIDRYVFSGSVAVVNQDIILFEDTIANNIRMWDTSIEDFEIILAAKDAQVHEEIMKRDGGYQYKLTEGGRDFSGGQRQRMEIARVLAADPTLIIMDEATSALDAKTEFDVVRAIKERGITCIVIAHRLSTIRDCDEIIVMDKGNVVERGTHEELMAREGMYTQLIASE